MRNIRQFLFAFFFLSSFLLRQKDAGSICTTNLKGVAISQKFKESLIIIREILIVKCCGEFVFQVASERCSSERHPDVTVLMRKEIIHFVCW